MQSLLTPPRDFSLHCLRLAARSVYSSSHSSSSEIELSPDADLLDGELAISAATPVNARREKDSS